MRFSFPHAPQLAVLSASCALYGHFIWAAGVRVYRSIHASAPGEPDSWPAAHAFFFSLSNAVAIAVLVLAVLYVATRQRALLGTVAVLAGVHAAVGFGTYASTLSEGLRLSQSPVAWWLPPVLLCVAACNALAFFKQRQARHA